MWMAANWHADYIRRMNRVNSCNDFGHDNNTVIMRHVMDTSLSEARTSKAAVTCEHDQRTMIMTTTTHMRVCVRFLCVLLICVYFW